MVIGHDTDHVGQRASPGFAICFVLQVLTTRRAMILRWSLRPTSSTFGTTEMPAASALSLGIVEELPGSTPGDPAGWLCVVDAVTALAA
jgi:hypothetical protein